ncbi:phage replisome organizer N-terminal domain-containing protein [Clostridium beijerinckii]|uniref:Phage replisome organizer n=1 Tax=Clostridium beijerinckii TaxID=1520 RepID=A0A1S9N2I6_CLOBE|nr:phage replisome organizer N-terminal domain-containing protein [Clostridium beijerinckii]OOP71730.1 phage replisome organizer [Clostridium beijerinckii]
MADIKWIKLATNMHDDEKIKLIDSMPQRDTIHYVWIRILLLGGKLNANGEIFLSEGKPLTAKMLAILFSRPLEDIKIALKVLSDFGMIEIAPDKVIRIVNWDKHQNIEGMERVREQNRKRAENHREKKKQEKKAAKSNSEIYENIDLDEMEELEPIEDNETLNKNEEIENLENSGEMSADFNDNNKTNVVTNVETHNNITEDINSNSNVTKNIGNVTQNKNNVTVTEQNKKEKEIENKKKNKIKKEKRERVKENHKNNILEDIKNKELVDNQDVPEPNLSQSKNLKEISLDQVETDINSKAIEIMQYHERITGRVGGDKYIALREALDIHGEKWVKRAINMALEKNNMTIDYAIGILKNWRRDGYPRDDMEVNKNGFRSTGKNNTEDKNRFAGFKPKEPRRLTEAERKQIEATLI